MIALETHQNDNEAVATTKDTVSFYLGARSREFLSQPRGGIPKSTLLDALIERYQLVADQKVPLTAEEIAVVRKALPPVNLLHDRLLVSLLDQHLRLEGHADLAEKISAWDVGLKLALIDQLERRITPAKIAR